jgi:putative transposase
MQQKQELVQEYGFTVSRACKLKTIPRSHFYYENKKEISDVIEILQVLTFKHPTYGFRLFLLI